MVRKTTSLKVNIELWKKVKKRCIDSDQDLSDYIEELIQRDLKK